MADSTTSAIIALFSEPVFLLDDGGLIEQANPAATSLLESGDLIGRRFGDFVASSHAKLDAFLDRCSGATRPLVGSLTLEAAGGACFDLRFYGTAVPADGDELRPGLALRGTHQDAGQSSALAAKVPELNTEIRVRRQTQAVLEETLREREVLMRELHHRVNNSFQMMISMLALAEREADTPETGIFLGKAKQRLMAMSAIQRLLYHSSSLESIPARAFISTICDTLRETVANGADLRCRADDAPISNDAAMPLTVIINELVTNAVKHGLTGRSEGKIEVRLDVDGTNQYCLTVRDDGDGFTVPTSSLRASGLGLVRGLVRQLGGRLEIYNDRGAVCSVRFRDYGTGVALQ